MKRFEDYVAENNKRIFREWQIIQSVVLPYVPVQRPYADEYDEFAYTHDFTENPEDTARRHFLRDVLQDWIDLKRDAYSDIHEPAYFQALNDIERIFLNRI